MEVLKILKILKIMKVSIMKLYIYQIKENYSIKTTKLILFHIIQIILKILQVKEDFHQIIQILVEPLTNSINLELREANENSKIVDDNLTLNYSNLAKYSISNVESDEAKMEGSI